MSESNGSSDELGLERAVDSFLAEVSRSTIPEERVPLVHWEGIDGTRLPALAKTELCLHQWPEDFEGRLESPLLREHPLPALVQWVELLPSPDWMCRSEVLLRVTHCSVLQDTSGARRGPSPAFKPGNHDSACQASC